MNGEGPDSGEGDGPENRDADAVLMTDQVDVKRSRAYRQFRRDERCSP